MEIDSKKGSASQKGWEPLVYSIKPTIYGPTRCRW